MSSPYFQAVDPSAAPDPVTPADSPSNPSGFAGVTPHGQGPAPYSIQAPLEDLSAVFADAGRLSAGQENDIYPTGPRQSQAQSMMESAAGYSAQDITAGWSGGGGDGWPNSPGVATAETPDQETGDFQGTGTD